MSLPADDTQRAPPAPRDPSAEGPKALEQQREQTELFLTESPVMVYRRSATAPYGFTFISSNVDALLGFHAADLVAGGVQLSSRLLAEDSIVLEDALAQLGSQRVRVTYRMLDALGVQRWLQDEMRLVHDRAGRPSHIVGHLMDVTERQALMDELVRSEERHALAVQGAQAGLWDLDVGTNRIFLSPRVIEMLGYGEDEVEPYVDLEFLLGHIHPEDRPHVDSSLRAHLAGRGPFNVECRATGKGGSSKWFHVCGQANWVGDLQPARVAGWLSDISERRRLEEELRQAQKMEAIGRLAGGVAHDFNNLLSVILGSAQLVEQELPSDHPAAEDAREIVLAAKRAATLTRQLLAFSRQQRVEPRVVDLSETIRSLQGMLRRLIGEDIELLATRSPEHQTIRIDPGQLEQVILNLVVNARDAMREGGRIVISTRRSDSLPADATVGANNVGPGPYVVLCVSDSGHGMDAETRARIFEPFFTTKERGKGTGLGLATVYGIVSQSRGRIAVESEPGHGTTFRVYFAGCDAVEAEPRTPDATISGRRGNQGRVVLLAEDDDQLRALARKILEAAGCRVIAARDGQEAIGLAAKVDGPINLLVTDIVMPGMSGPQLLAAMMRVRPTLRALFMSGYADRGELPAEGTPILQKPFSPQALASLVGQMLDETREPEPQAAAAAVGAP